MWIVLIIRLIELLLSNYTYVLDESGSGTTMTFQLFVQSYYGVFLVTLMVLLWIGRLVTWRYDISIGKRTCLRKNKPVRKKFYFEELLDYDFNWKFLSSSIYTIYIYHFYNWRSKYGLQHSKTTTRQLSSRSII